MTLIYILLSSAIVLLLFIMINKISEVYKLKKRNDKISQRVIKIHTEDRLVIIKEMNNISKNHSDLDLLNIANQYSWPGIIISCMPRLYFLGKNNDNYSIVWKETLNLIPSDYLENPRKLTPTGQIKLTPFGHFKLTP